MGEVLPRYLKIMQNGSIGEARTKSFLIDRFWILERSVDVDGADFLIQARPSDQEFLNTMPPKFGRVQAKFIQDYGTRIKLKKQYVLDFEGLPRHDFFLIIHTGNENAKKIHLLQSEDILRENPNVLDDSYHLLVHPELYVVNDNSLSLDRIENSIRYTDFFKNRTFIFSNLDIVEKEYGDIQPIFKENIYYNFGTIPEIFIEQKTVAFKYIKELEHIHNELKNFIESTDPIEATIIAERLHYELESHYHFSTSEIFSQDYYFNCKRHLTEVNWLKSDYALDNYICGRKKIEKSMRKYCDDCFTKISSDTLHQITVIYDTDNLFVKSISHEFVDQLQKEYIVFIKSEEGNLVYSYKLGKNKTYFYNYLRK